MNLGRAVCIAGLMATSLAMQACDPKSDISELKVTYGDWVPLTPGDPAKAAEEVAEVDVVLRQGQGTAVAFGDAVQVQLRNRYIASKFKQKPETDEGIWWVWIAFAAGSPPVFIPSAGHRLPASLLGLNQGSIVTFKRVVSKETSRADKEIRSPGLIGGANQSLFKATWGGGPKSNPNAVPGERDHATVYGSEGDYITTTVEIVRVCKGQASQRAITLFDNTPMRVGQDIGRSYMTSEPRWSFRREAKWEGVCSDGKHARFKYGPFLVETPTGQTKGMDISLLFDPWAKQEWEKVPYGVVLSDK
jgi:hypothetical protein